MDPIPPPEPPESPSRPPWWWAIVYPLALFLVSMTVNVWQRERQNEQLKRQADELNEIKAMLERRDGALPPQGRR